MSYDAPPPPPGEPTPEPPSTPEPYQPPAASTPPPPPPPPPPAPPGGYPPPPPGGGNPPPPTGGGGPVDPNAVPPDPIGAITYGWRTFLAHAGQIIVAVLVYVAVLIVVELVFAIIVRAAISPSGLFGQLFFSALTTGVVVVVISVIQAGIARASLGLTDGRSISTADFFTGDQLGNVIVAALLIGVGAAIGFFLCYIPGVIWLFLVQFAIFFIVDKRVAPVDAIRASIKLVSDNLGVMILFYLLSAVVYFVGFCLVCVGLFVAIPVIIIAQAFLFRRLQNEPVAVV